MILVVLVNGLGAWPASYAVSSETSALRLRARSQGIGWFSYSLASGVMSFVLPYIYNPDSGDLRAQTGYVLSGSCIFGLVVAWFLVPELKDRSIVEIDQMFTLQLKTREFRGWKAEEEELPYPSETTEKLERPVRPRLDGRRTFTRTITLTEPAIPEEEPKLQGDTSANDEPSIPKDESK